MEVANKLKELNLPELQDRETMKKILLDREYGYVPEMPFEIAVSEAKKIEGRYCCGTAAVSRVEMTITTQYGSHTFPVHRLLHDDGKKHPFFVFLNFRGNVPDFYYPVEEIVERGFDVLSFNYNDVTRDNPDFTNGLAAILLPDGQNAPETCGKIALWAWTASRILDYAETLPCLDMNNAAVVGHSRLGKTALVAGMMDERFRFVFSNDSGCSGAALARGRMTTEEEIAKFTERGEKIKDIMCVGYWFCKKYADYTESCIPEGFDQHFLLATVAPRNVYVASAALDGWAAPDSEFMACVAASQAYETMGLTGFVHDGKIPGVDVTFHKGNIGYHRRSGKHFLSRIDWNRYMDYIELHKQEK